MKTINALLMTVMIFVFTGLSLYASADLTDPYQILDKHFEAIGGLEKIKAVESSYSEATVAMAGLEGTIKQWNAEPNLSRQEFDLKVFRETSGDNGKFSWSVDANGKVQIRKDEQTLKRRDVAKLMAEYDYINPDSKNFTLSFEGVEKISDADCYVVKIGNSINDDETLNYYDVSTFYNVKTLGITPDMQTHALHSDFREVDGVIMAFQEKIEMLPVGQKLSIQIVKYEANPEIDPNLFEPPGEDVKDYEFTGGGAFEIVPFQYIGEHLYIMVNINGKERLWILDTGASMTCISRRFADELGLEAKGEMKGSGAGNTVEVAFTTLPAYSIEGIKFNPQQVAVLDIAMFFDRFGMDVAGIMGFDFLSRFTSKVDYTNRTLTFYEPGEFTYSGDGNVIDAPLQGNMFTAPITVDGKYTGRCTIDLGAGSDNIHYAFATENGFQERDGIEKYGMGAGGEFREKRLKFSSMEFGGYIINDPLVDIPLDKLAGAFGSKEIMGNLGNTLFRHFVLYLDYADQKMYIEKGGDFGKDFPTDHSGLQVWFNEQKQYEVRHASPGTPAEKAGLAKGDIIESINGIDTEYFGGYEAVVDLLCEEPGTRYEFNILRDGEKKKIKLKLADLFE